MIGFMRALVDPLTPPDESRERAARRACLRWAAGLAAAAAALTVPVEARWGPLWSADRSISEDLHDAAVASPGLTRVNRVLTDWVWDPVTMRLLALAVIAYLLLGRARRLALWVAATSAVGLGVQAATKLATARQRPRFPDAVDSAHGWAFPSGHVMTATITFGLVVALVVLLGAGGRAVRTAVWAVAVVSAAGVAFTRVFLGVHWCTDAVAGWLLGGAVLAVCSAVCAPWRGTSWSTARARVDAGV
jgi:undecaprenyl-diphosphatase